MPAQFSDDFIGFVTTLEKEFWNMADGQNSCGVCVCAQLAREPEIPESLRKLTIEHFEEIGGVFYQVALNSQEAGKINKSLTPMEISNLSALIMNGLMTVGQSMGDVNTAKELLNGTIGSWLKLLEP